MDRHSLPYGEVWVACDDDDDVISVAVWMLPNSAVPASVLNEIGRRSTLEGARHEASVEAEACVARLRPTMPHYYLGAVGTRRDRQREGLGAAAAVRSPRSRHRGNEPVFLETSASRMSASMSGSGWSRLARLTYPTVVPTSGR